MSEGSSVGFADDRSEKLTAVHLDFRSECVHFLVAKRTVDSHGLHQKAGTFRIDTFDPHVDSLRFPSPPTTGGRIQDRIPERRSRRGILSVQLVFLAESEKLDHVLGGNSVLTCHCTYPFVAESTQRAKHERNIQSHFNALHASLDFYKVPHIPRCEDFATPLTP